MIPQEKIDERAAVIKQFEGFLKEQEEFATELGISTDRMIVLSLLRENKVGNDLTVQLIKTIDALMKETHKLHEVVAKR